MTTEELQQKANRIKIALAVLNIGFQFEQFNLLLALAETERELYLSKILDLCRTGE